jgi:predicted site-specific integrase-resolvase
MSEAQSQEKVTIAIASKVLNVDRRTIYRWMDKGLLSKVKEGNSTCVLMDDVRALRNKAMSHDKKVDVAKNSDKDEAVNDTVTGTVTVERTHYEGLLTRLGQLEAKQELLLEYREGLQAKDKELANTKAALEARERELAEIKAEVDRLRLPWWKRLWRK